MLICDGGIGLKQKLLEAATALTCFSSLCYNDFKRAPKRAISPTPALTRFGNLIQTKRVC